MRSATKIPLLTELRTERGSATRSGDASSDAFGLVGDATMVGCAAAHRAALRFYRNAVASFSPALAGRGGRAQAPTLGGGEKIRTTELYRGGEI